VGKASDNDNAKDEESTLSTFVPWTERRIRRCKAAIDELNDNFVLGNDVHPADVPAAIMVLTNPRGHGGSRQRHVEDLSAGLSVVSFAQESKQGHGRSKIQWHRCNQCGHMSKKCKTVLDNQESKRG